MPHPTADPSAAQRSAPRSSLRDRLDAMRRGALWIGVAVVLGVVAVLAGWSSTSTRALSARAVETSLRSHHYAAAAEAVATEEAVGRRYRLAPGPRARLDYDNAVAEVQQQMARLRVTAGPADLATAEAVLAAHASCVSAVGHLFAAVDRGDAARAARIDGDEVAPAFERLRQTAEPASAVRRGEAIDALLALRQRQATNERAAPVAALVGLAFVIVCGMLLAHTRRALDDERQRAVQAALHDALTGLPNRALLADRFERALAVGRRDGTTTGLMLIDLDRFKEVNDTLGHHVGDKLLAQIGPRLVRSLREGDTVARLGGDEFAVLLPVVDGAMDALDIANRLRTTLTEAFQIEGALLDIDASIGVVVSGAHGDDPAMLLQRADVAMYVAKRQCLGVALYDYQTDSHSPERLGLLGQLRRALERNELLLHYQPKVSLATGELVGVEALVRWQHAERGLVPPVDFIPLAENTGLIGPLTLGVLEQALAQMRLWLDGGVPMRVAVNVSARNLLDDGFSAKITALLAKHGVPARLLEVEVTESAVMVEPQRAQRVLRQLHALGIRIAIDDFGAGYTSLAQLKHLPVSQLKIDSSFIFTMHTDPDNALIVRSVVDLGHSLGMTVVAEGVETAEAAATLARYGCDVAQGYHYARPMPAAALLRWAQLRPDPVTVVHRRTHPPASQEPAGFVVLQNR
jgi:diguanylate cyclase